MGLDAPSTDLTENIRKKRRERVRELAAEGNELVRIGKPIEVTKLTKGKNPTPPSQP